MAATRACFGGTRHQSAHHEEEEEDKGSLRQCSGLLHHFPPPGLAFPAPACLLCSAPARLQLSIARRGCWLLLV